jgi:DNA-binding NarL/FixJ family response regulator
VPRIIIADDHPLIREGLRKVLASEADMYVVGEAADFSSLLVLVQSMPADVALVDINMPGAGALETLRNIRVRRPSLPVVVLSMMPEGQLGLDLLICGAAAYVSKEAAAHELVTAIRRVVGGHRYVSPILSQRIARGPAPSREQLSPRELEVLCLIASGLAVKEVAARLTIGISTVHTHRARILDKLNLRSNVELSRYAIRHRLVDWK